MAAAAGGFTTICCMPNTSPVMDSPALLEILQHKLATDAVVSVLPIAAISAGSKGSQTVDFHSLRQYGACAFSDDGHGVMSSRLMLSALEAGAQLAVPIVAHEEDSELAAGGSVNAGLISQQLGDPGIPGVSEYAMVARDIYLAALSGGHLHVAHVSCAETVRLIREAKAKGVRVTAEVTPHHLALNESVVPELGGLAKVNPPLRSAIDQEAVCAGLADGTIDIIATDHAPHAMTEKLLPLAQAAFGFSGLETAFAVSYDQLVLSRKMTLLELLRAMTLKPAEILGLRAGRLTPGYPADLVVLDLEQQHQLGAEDLYSLGKNNPFLGRRLTGRPVLTMVGGRIVYDGRKENA
jgi:dihydroorotase